MNAHDPRVITRYLANIKTKTNEVFPNNVEYRDACAIILLDKKVVGKYYCNYYQLVYGALVYYLRYTKHYNNTKIMHIIRQEANALHLVP